MQCIVAVVFTMHKSWLDTGPQKKKRAIKNISETIWEILSGAYFSSFAFIFS
jgi:hypothetical protein